MESNPYISHPSTAQEASRFQQQQLPASASFPNGAGHLTPPSGDKDASQRVAVTNGQANGQVNGQTNGASSQSNGVAPSTPAATPGANAVGATGASGIVPTLQ